MPHVVTRMLNMDLHVNYCTRECAAKRTYLICSLSDCWKVCLVFECYLYTCVWYLGTFKRRLYLLYLNVGSYNTRRATCGRCSTARMFYLGRYLFRRLTDSPVARDGAGELFPIYEPPVGIKVYEIFSRLGYLSIYLGTSINDNPREKN